MIHTYNIEGMTCSGCQSTVEQSLINLPEVSEVLIDLSIGEVKVTMTSHVSLKTLQLALPNKYKISEVKPSNVFDSISSKNSLEESDLKKLRPLFLIFLYITVAAIFLNISPWETNGFMLDFMGLFYIVFSFFKFLDLKGFPESFRMYDPLAKALPAYAMIYPFLELSLGLCFLFRFQVNLALILALIILGITTLGVTNSLIRKESIKCACLGTILKLPMTKATFIENTIMLIMATYMLVNVFMYEN